MDPGERKVYASHEPQFCSCWPAFAATVAKGQLYIYLLFFVLEIYKIVVILLYTASILPLFFIFWFSLAQALNKSVAKSEGAVVVAVQPTVALKRGAKRGTPAKAEKATPVYPQVWRQNELLFCFFML